MEKGLECAVRRCSAGEDIDVAASQLGRRPDGMAGVACRCPYGAPAVLICDPVVIRRGGRAEPFPTVYWLTCPRLREAVGSLEGGEWFGAIRGHILEDEAFRSALLDLSDRYKALRAGMFEGLAAEVRGMVTRKATEDLLSSGPGGVKDPLNVKCLHIHLANWLAGMGDPVGAAVAEIIAGRRG